MSAVVVRGVVSGAPPLHQEPAAADARPPARPPPPVLDPHPVARPRVVAELLRGDREVVLAAVQRQGSVLRFCADWMRGDREIVLAAVGQDGLALQWAGDSVAAGYGGSPVFS